ncbi:LLM class flavin-dependent oxidoreductase [Paenibacillus senegalensis]|uniref:LLM class flavin-dependent oxidoreductase n=1 Tax=Paenibacillus senegalensis TaxID=1465766 RepID=UPI0002895C37|nr:LLM class flavin-dependent oxidoreductase [Paenibacillus senegalensis]
MSETKQPSKTLSQIPLSILDLAPVLAGQTPADSFRNSLELARKAEQWGYHRYWLAEHHNMVGIASSATSVLIGYIAGGTSTIRVGSGGVMLPNHAPLVIAEQFGTLESLYPGRIDLGLGRAPGSDSWTTLALRRDPRSAAHDFPDQVEELVNYFQPKSEHPRVRAVPGEGLSIPIWLLGSSTFSAQLAAVRGLPFSFASHFAPDSLFAALDVYRQNFQPSEDCRAPYVMLGINVICADTNEEAEFLASSIYQTFLNLARGLFKPLQPPVANMDELWSPIEKASILQKMTYTLVGDPAAIRQKLDKLLDETGADELMVTANIYSHEARLKSFELLSQVHRGKK